ncbi:MAG: hypothetical protein CL947_01985 [Epsilonproteobacteria bacterium]|nr:hypothetical protein [Campylobacterota bacterium]|tara:strand:- start:1983 stop:2798 length:816 start_codon:yes stop_codon:yes gene_type:complete
MQFKYILFSLYIISEQSIITSDKTIIFDNYGRTELHNKARKCFSFQDFCNTLQTHPHLINIQTGHDKKQKSTFASTPAHACAHAEQWNKLEELIAQGADPYIKNSYKETVVQSCSEEKKQLLCQQAIERGFIRRNKELLATTQELQSQFQHQRNQLIQLLATKNQHKLLKKFFVMWQNQKQRYYKLAPYDNLIEKLRHTPKTIIDPKLQQQISKPPSYDPFFTNSLLQPNQDTISTTESSTKNHETSKASSLPIYQECEKNDKLTVLKKST